MRKRTYVDSGVLIAATRELLELITYRRRDAAHPVAEDGDATTA
jgi:hypothetical protein